MGLKPSHNVPESLSPKWLHGSQMEHAPVGAGADVAVLHVELVIVLAAQLARPVKAAADLKALFPQGTPQLLHPSTPATLAKPVPVVLSTACSKVTPPLQEHESRERVEGFPSHCGHVMLCERQHMCGGAPLHPQPATTGTLRAFPLCNRGKRARLGGGQRHEGLGQLGLELVEDGRAEALGAAAHHACDFAAARVARDAHLVDDCARDTVALVSAPLPPGHPTHHCSLPLRFHLSP